MKRVKFLAKTKLRYVGHDMGFPVKEQHSFTLLKGDSIEVTEAKAAQLKADFPEDFEVTKATGEGKKEAKPKIPSPAPKELKDHTVAELQEIATEEGIELGDATRKDDIVAAIELAREG